MRKKHYWYVLILFLLMSYSSCSNKKTFDLGSFEITVPKVWKFKHLKAIDSYAGVIAGPGIEINFDLSGQGYANGLIETEKDFLINSKYLLENRPYDRIDTDAENGFVTFADLLYNGRVKPFVHKDTIVTILKVIANQESQFPNADYIATIKVSKNVRCVPITIPHRIKSHHIVVDTIRNYIRKTIWPKIPGKGMTGIYIHSRKTDFNFMMCAENLSLENQQLALAAFKTITFKK